MIDDNTKFCLQSLESIINTNIDILIPKRDAAKGKKDFYTYRYIVKKLETALNAVHMAQDKIKEMEK